MSDTVEKIMVIVVACFSSGVLFGSLYYRGMFPTQDAREFGVAMAVVLLILGMMFSVWVGYDSK